MKRHTVVLSDIHLCELEPTSGAWMRYRQREQAPDRAIASMIDALLAELTRAASEDGEPHELTLALNGDIVDFDAPRVVDGESRFHDEPRDDAHSVPAIEAVLRDHPVFVAAVAEVLAAGHKVLFVSGNHDAQITLPGVRDVIRRFILDAASLACGGASTRESLASRLLFRAWFYVTEDGIHIEHGGQYDPYCVFHYPTAPYHKDTKSVQPTLGSLASRLMTSRMGYFNPNVDSSYELTAGQYVAHWIRYYIGSPHSIVVAWLDGALSSFVRLMRARDPGDPERRRASLHEACLETGVPEAKLIEHMSLFAAPVELSSPVRAARELWVDRLTLTVSSTGWAASWLVLAPASLAPAALALLLLFVLYEFITPKIRVRDRYASVDARALDVARVHGAKAIVFGHTHHPHGYTHEGVFIGNSGSWGALYHDVECTRPVFPSRPLIWLTSDGGPLKGGLVAWTGASFEPRESRPSHDHSKSY